MWIDKGNGRFGHGEQPEPVEPPPTAPPIDIPQSPRIELTPEACALLVYRVMADEPLSYQDLAEMFDVPRAEVSRLEERLYHLLWVRADAAYPLEQLWRSREADFPSWLKMALERIGYTQAQLADEVGVTRAAVSAWVRGVAQPNATRLKKIEKFLGLRFSGAMPDEPEDEPR